MSVFKKKIYHQITNKILTQNISKYNITSLSVINHAKLGFYTPNVSLNHRSIYHFTTDNDPKKPEPQPMIVRFLNIFRVEPKVRRILERSRAFENNLALINLVSSSIAMGVYVFALTSGMSYFEISTAPFAALMGAGGAAIGFGLKDIANNYISGILLVLQGYFKRGDEVTVAGKFRGNVIKMNLRHLELEIYNESELKNEIIYIPNANVFASHIIIHKKMGTNAPNAMETNEEAAQHGI